MNDPLLAWRPEFPVLERCHYLVSHSLGAMPRGVRASLAAYADSWERRGVRAWNESWWTLGREVADSIAPLLNAPAGSLVLQQNASIANSVLFSALDFSDPRRNRVVISDMDFPSDSFALRQWTPPGVDICMLRSPDGIGLDIDELLAAIDERTRLVSLSHVLFRSGCILPARDIVTRAQAVGAQVLLNGYHSVGVIPVDVAALEVDFYVGGTLKWLCGGPGGVFLYVRPDLLAGLRPKVSGWLALQQPFAFDSERFPLREDIGRLQNGTPGIASLHAIRPGIDIVRKVGVAAIRKKSRRQTALLVDLARRAGHALGSPLEAERRAGTVTLMPAHAWEVSRELLARDYVVDYREGAGIRIAPHFYTCDGEARGVMQAVDDILADGSWRRHSAQGPDHKSVT
ncbi:MAG: aminotransferase class V-fold PLP-dependent enzyme [Anaerolineaceae bacterium]|nr:aminotransferase class V-fold PLP-dependent enzyme [Anaerolineaceae bacterium]MDE0327468.1 aminotransferase class V-fold PLP-dependent enzyme [Anaerolineaceae bacterium]